MARKTGPIEVAEPPSSSPVIPQRLLGVDEIVEAGLNLGLEQGFESLSMRALARELGVSPMAIYHHVGNKDDLLVLLVDAVLAGIDVPAPDSGPWDERLRILDGTSVALLATWRGIDAIMYRMRPTPHGWRLINAYIEILLDAGFNERGAALAFSVIHSYGLGRTGMADRLSRSRHEHEGPPPAWSALARVQPHWADLNRSDYRGFAFDVLIAGLQTILRSDRYRQKPATRL
ncbi:TetR/AcrR family transcriptional regulator [Jatrophihabitans sp. DSM 45814]